MYYIYYVYIMHIYVYYVYIYIYIYVVFEFSIVFAISTTTLIKKRHIIKRTAILYNEINSYEKTLSNNLSRKVHMKGRQRSESKI